MPLTATINFNDSEAHSKLLLLLGLTELQINEPVQTVGKNSVTTKGTGKLLNCLANLTITETKNYRARTIELNMEATKPVSLAHMSSLLQLNPYYHLLYQGLEFSNLTLYASASDASDFEFLTIEGHLLEDDTLLGFLAKEAGVKNALTDLKLAVHITHRKGSYNKNIRVTINAQLALGGQTIEIELSVPLQKNELWSLRLLPPGVAFNINTLLKLGMSNESYKSLPIQVTSIPDFNLNSFSIEFDPSSPNNKLQHIGMALGVGKSGDRSWLILGTEEKPIVSLNNIHLSLDMYWGYDGKFSYRGIVNGKGAISGFSIAATVPIPLQGIMTLEVSSANEHAQLPSLTDFSKDLIGDKGLSPHLPEGDISRFSLYLNRLRLAINLDKRAVQEFELDIKSSENGLWVIWKDHLELNEFGLNVLLQKQEDGWQASGALYGKGTIQKTPVAVSLQKPATGPWELALAEPIEFGLSKAEALAEKNLSQNSDNILPAKLDASDGKALGVSLRNFKLQFQHTEPKFPYLGLYIETTGRLEIFKDKLALESVFCLLELRYSGKNRITAVQVGGKLAIGKHTISLRAGKTDEDKGWEYEGKTEPGDNISLNELLDVLLKPVDVSLPATLPQVAVRNIELYYAPKIKQVTFKGESQIDITDTINALFSLSLDSKSGKEEKDRLLIIKGGSYIEICDASFFLTAAYDSTNKEGWRFTGRASDDIEFTALLRKMLANTVLALPEVLPVKFTLNKANFEVAPAVKYYFLSGRAELDIRIPQLTSGDTFPLKLTLGITLERPAVEMPEAPAEKLNIDLDASATWVIIPDKASVMLGGSYSTDKKGWEFDGELTFAQGLKFGELLTALGKQFNTQFSIPAILDKEIPLTRAGASINTAAKTFICYSDFAFTINKNEVALTTRLTLTQNNDNTSTTVFLGNIALGKKEDPYNFNLIFDKRPNSTWLLANYAGASDSMIDIGEFINATLNIKGAPSGLTIQLNQALMVYHPAGKEGEVSKALFLMGIGNGINLSNLPLVGKYFTPDKTLKLNFRIEYANEKFNKDDIKSINELLTTNTKTPELKVGDLEQGFDLSVSLQIGETIKPINLNLALKVPVNKNEPLLSDKEDDGDILKPKDDSKDVLNGGLSKWFDVQKKMGPLYFNRIGIGFKDGNLQFMFDASISAWGLTIALAGLTVSNPLNRVKPVFSLNGLGIDYKNEIIEIGGSFLRTHVDEKGSDGYYEYNGLAVIKVKESPDDAKKLYAAANEETSWSITAIGSYAYVNDSPSLFVYAALSYPIGGPAFFFVNGLSAGFGYNRRIVIPALNKVMEFPLLAETLQGKSMPENAGRDFLLQELQVLHQYIPPANGQIFLAIGLTFSTFEVIDTSLLLVASFGNRFELDLLGVSTLVVPSVPEEDIEGDDKKVPTRLANVTLLLKGSFVPSEGFLGIQGVIAAKSYILSKDCVLSGGFAFFAWFNGEHKGDFVATVGGYHPHFNVPAHYPKVPRVGFNWKLDEHMLIKGDVYFALCAHALMAGGHLEATFESGGLKAWFKLGADFLVAWQPYHYEVRMYVDIGCSYTFEFCGTQHITLDLGADVDIWGPEFGGHAVLHLWIFSIDVNFGNQESASPVPIDWKTFAGSFLPKENLLNITVGKGLVTKGTDEHHLGIVNPKELTIITDAFIPTKSFTWDDKPYPIKCNTEFGIGSMKLEANNVKCVQNIHIEKINDRDFNANDHFRLKPITKKVPAGLWGTKLKPEVNGAEFIDDALMGVSILPKGDNRSDKGISVDRNFVTIEPSDIPNAIAWETEKTITENVAEGRKAFISRDIKQKNSERQALLKALGLKYAIDIADNLGEDLTTEPVIVASYS